METLRRGEPAAGKWVHGSHFITTLCFHPSLPWLAEDSVPWQGVREVKRESKNSYTVHTMPVSQLSVPVTKYLRKSSFKEGKFILAHDLNEQTPGSLTCYALKA